MARPINAPLVGMHYRPPADKVVKMLGVKTTLTLQRQPDNPHDSNAVQVILQGFEQNGPHGKIWAEMVEEALGDPEHLGRLTNPLHLGYIDAKKTGMAAVISEVMDRLEVSAMQAELQFDEAGKPMVVLDLDDAQVQGNAQEPISEFAPTVLDVPQAQDETNDEDDLEEDLENEQE